MNTKNLIVLFVFLGLFGSCSKNDDSIKNEVIAGIWYLKNVNGGFPGINIDYENGIVSWEFIPETNSLIVVSTIINTGPQSAYLPLKNGNYNYTLTTLNDKTFISIKGFEIYNNGEYGSYLINEKGELQIDQGEGSEASASDVFTLLFDKKH